MVRCEFTRGVLAVRTGSKYAFEDVTRAIRAALDDESVEPGTPLLLDIRESEQTRTRDELRALADLIATGQGRLHHRCAVLAQDALRFGLARQFSGWAASRSIEVRVFAGEQEESAREWLLTGATDSEGSTPGA
jgi:hypothetical protein